MPKIIKKLTEAEIRNARPRKKPYRLCDEGGLRLLIRPSGTKVWQYPYKFQGKSNVYTIGKYSAQERGSFVTTAEARNARDDVKELIISGIDPNHHKKTQQFHLEEQSQTTFEAIAREWHGRGTWVEKHAKNILKSLECDVFPFIGYKQISQVNSQEVVHVLSNVEKRGAYDVAKRICQRCEAIFDYAMVKGVCDNNPASGRAKYIDVPKRQNRPHLKEHQLPDYLKKLSGYHGRNYIRLALELQTHIFLRPGELRHLEWDFIDFQKKQILIPAKNMKMDRDHIIPMSEQVVNILKEIQAITGHTTFLFPSVRTHLKPISDVTLLKALKTMGYVDEHKIVPHGFRHTASTILNDHGFNRDHIERQLAHIDNNSVRRAYNHAEYVEERAKMMQWYSNFLDQKRG